MPSVAVWSEIGIEHAFEVVSSVKGGKVYKWAAESEEDCDGWMAAIDSVIVAQGPATEITRNPSSSDAAAPSPFKLEPEPGHSAGSAAAPFEMEQWLGARLVPEPESDR
jgi:hypothetical protein